MAFRERLPVLWILRAVWYGAKADPVVTVIPVAKTGKFEIRTHSYVRRILHKGGKATGVMYTDLTTGEEIEQPADIVVSTGYVFNNTRLMLLSKIGKPYDSSSGTGVIARTMPIRSSRECRRIFEDKFNLFAGAGSLGMSLDDFNGDNFDHSDLKFIHGEHCPYGNRPTTYSKQSCSGGITALGQRV